MRSVANKIHSLNEIDKVVGISAPKRKSGNPFRLDHLLSKLLYNKFEVKKGVRLNFLNHGWLHIENVRQKAFWKLLSHKTIFLKENELKVFSKSFLVKFNRLQ